MKNPEHGGNAYYDVTAPTKNARTAEYQAFAKVTRRLQLANTGEATKFAELAKGIHENLRLWNVIAADIAIERNSLPPRLKAQIFSLSEFTRHHSQRVLAGSATAGILVEINTAIMSGLRASLPSET